MRAARLVGLVVLTVWLQAGFLAAWHPLGVVPNLLLIVVVYAGLVASATEAVCLGLGGGLLLDWYSGGDFGLRMAFYSMEALAMAVIRQGGAEAGSFGLVAVLTGGATILFNLAIIGTLVPAGVLYHAPQLTTSMGLEVVLNVLLAGALGWSLRTVLRSHEVAKVEVSA